MASTFFSCTSLPNFWFLPDFVVVFIVIRLISLFVISYRSTMHDKHPLTPIEAYLCVIYRI